VGLLRELWKFVIRGPKKGLGGTLYIHYPCFDGLISGVLAWDFLEMRHDWTIENVCPVNYGLREQWLSMPLDSRSAIVDFLYHPKAGFWVDHHLTSFITDSVRNNFEQRRLHVPLVYDNRSGSSALLLWSHFGKFLSNEDRYKEMVGWAEKIDSAAYASVEEAVLGEAPALRINFSLMARDANTKDYCNFLIKQLRNRRTLADIADSYDVRTKYEQVRILNRRGLEYLRGRLTLTGNIVAFDVEINENMMISRYAPYYFFPSSSYSIGITRYSHGAKITAMRNPWRDFESVPLGTIFARYGGGGHQRVASVFLSGERANDVERIADQLLSEIRSHEGVRSPAAEAVLA
jgi:hypothetical protein